jgi:hypothetical protein
MHHNTHLYKLNRLTFIGCIAEQRKKAKGGKGEGGCGGLPNGKPGK